MEPWSELMIIMFLKKLESLPCLWDPENDDFRRNSIKASAYYELSQHMNIFGSGPELMQQKMSQLKYAFLNEKRRMYERKAVGQSFTPRFKWYSFAHSIWGKIKVRKYSYYDDEVRQSQNSTEGSTTFRAQDDALPGYLGKAVNALRHITGLTSGNEFDAFGRSVACQLKTMQSKSAYELQAEIQSLITDKKIKCMTTMRSKRTAATAATAAAARVVEAAAAAAADSKVPNPATIRLNQDCKEETIYIID